MNKNLLPKSEEHKNKISKAIKEWHKEVGHSNKTKNKISNSLKGKFTGSKSFLWKGGPKHSNCSICNKTISFKAKKCQRCYGKDSSDRMKGKPKSEEWKDSVRGENHHNWKNGKTKFSSLLRNSFEYKRWRSNVFKRDGWICQTCQKIGGGLEVHHKISFSKLLELYNIKSFNEGVNCKELWNEDNGITLCIDCHKLTKNYGRPKKETL